MGLNPGGPAAQLLRSCLDTYQAAGVEPPEAQYLAPGPLAAWDGPHLAACLVQVLPGTSDGTTKPGGWNGNQVGSVSTPRAMYEARVLRCIPTVDDNGPPHPDAITDAAQTLLVDCGLLLDAAFAWANALPLGTKVTVGQATPLGPEGGLAGYSVQCVASPLM